jgi:hypothetical protein
VDQQRGSAPLNHSGIEVAGSLDMISTIDMAEGREVYQLLSFPTRSQALVAHVVILATQETEIRKVEVRS